MTFFEKYYKNLIIILFPFILSLIIMSLGRLYLVYQFDILNTQASSLDIKNLFLIGFRFDVKIAAILFGSIFLISILISHIPFIKKFYIKFLFFISVLTLFLFFIFTLINIFYYQTFNRYIDTFIFGFIEDDTQAVIHTIWSDYPVIILSICIITFLIIFSMIFNHYIRYTNQLKIKTSSILFKIIFVLVTISLIAISTRGATGTFPLRRSDMNISSIKIVNDFIPNGLIAFQWAMKDQKINSQFEHATEQDGIRIFSTFFNKPITTPSLELLKDITPINKNITSKKPNVIFAVMESFGTHFILLKDHDVLGNLKKHFNDDWTFTNFVSEGNGTIDTLSRLLVRSPIRQISQSSAQLDEFDSNIFKPYIDNGYDIVFISTGIGSWQNLQAFTTHLGVDEFIDANTLTKLYPDAVLETWGTQEEFMFRYAESRLKEAEKKQKPVFIMMLSTTNHPPYKSPRNHDKQKFILSNKEQERFANFSKQTDFNEVLNTFLYSSNELGKLISYVKQDPNLSQNTIISFTGDHNLRGIGYPDSKELILGLAVPFYLYVPPHYQQGFIYDKNRVGSHKDILPTLYSLSLSQTPYYRTGCNLVSKNLISPWCNIGYNAEALITPNGAYDLILNQYYNWQNKQDLILSSQPSNIPKSDQELIKQWKVFPELLRWQINKQIQENKDK